MLDSEDNEEDEPQHGDSNMQEMVTLLLKKEEEIRILKENLKRHKIHHYCHH
jgi:hypothetical protein